MRRWERNGCAVHAELPFRFSVICNDEKAILKIVLKIRRNKDDIR